MVDNALLTQVMHLDEAERRELRDAIDESLPDYVAPEMVALLTERIAEADASPDDYLSFDEFKRRIAEGRVRRTA